MFTLQDRTILFEGKPIVKAAIPYDENGGRNIAPHVFDATLRALVAIANEYGPDVDLENIVRQGLTG